MFKFLRFELGGVSTFIWIIIFQSPYFNLPALFDLEPYKLVAAAIGSIAIFLPLGNYIHQFVDTVANPFLRYRARFYKRESLEFIENLLGGDKCRFKDRTYQSLIVFSEAISQDWKIPPNSSNVSGTKLDSWSLDARIVRENITNRYSYFYARIESGLFAPVLGWLIFVMINTPIAKSALFTDVPQYNSAWTFFAALIIGTGTVWRIPQIFREIDDLEIMLVGYQEKVWREMLPRVR